MDSTLLWKTVVLGIVEGLTEFLPVSSTGHLILMETLIGFEGPPGKVFEIVIQLGAILAICWIYRAKLLEVAAGLVSEPPARRFVLNLLVGFLPAAVLGVVFHKQIKTVLLTPGVVCASLFIGGIVILLVERMRLRPLYRSVDEFSWLLALKIGLCQCVAMIPGVSRAGATIIGGLLLGAERKAATEFSFFLAIPTMLGATVYDSYKNIGSFVGTNLLVIVVGFIVAFITAMLVVRALIAFVSTHGFAPFGWYRIVVGGVGGILLLLQ
jgi:undecaprenyl-diphosphatase